MRSPNNWAWHHILEGSVQKGGENVRVIVQLIRAVDDTHIWAEIFDRKVTDIFSVESEIANTVAEHLSATLTGREKQVINAKPTDKPRGLRRVSEGAFL